MHRQKISSAQGKKIHARFLSHYRFIFGLKWRSIMPGATFPIRPRPRKLDKSHQKLHQDCQNATMASKISTCNTQPSPASTRRTKCITWGAPGPPIPFNLTGSAAASQPRLQRKQARLGNIALRKTMRNILKTHQQFPNCQLLLSQNNACAGRGASHVSGPT